MPDALSTSVVTVDDGTGPVKAIRDVTGRLITAPQLQMIRDKQQADLDRAGELKDKLVAGDAQTTSDVIGQMRDEMNRRLAMLDRQRGELARTLEQLQAGNAPTTQSLVGQMIARLDQRISLTKASRNRSDALLTQMAPVDTKPVVAPPATEAAVNAGS